MLFGSPKEPEKKTLKQQFDEFLSLDQGKRTDSSASSKFVFPFAGKQQQQQQGRGRNARKSTESAGAISDVWQASTEVASNGVRVVKDFVKEIRFLQVLTGFLLALGLVGGSVAVTGNAVSTALAQNGNGKVLERAVQFGTIFQNIKEAYVDRNVDLDLLFEKGVNAMLTTLDPYSAYENAKESEDLVMRTTGRYAGVGITIGKAEETEDNVLVFNAFEGYAFNAGVRAGDKILKIDDKPVASLAMDDVKDLLRGEPGTSVTLTIQRDGSPEKTLSIPINRKLVRLPDVTLATVDADGTGYMKLEGFSEGTAEETERAIRIMQTERNLKSLVIDMRDNPGGVLDAAVAVSQQLVPEGTEIVSTSGRVYGEGTTLSYRSTTPPVLNPNTRLVLLVNGNTASAAEIVAGAVQDTDRGIVVGERTFGKGLVQVVEPLPAGASLKLTVAKYFTPSGRSIQALSYKDGRLKASTTDVKAAAKEASVSQEAVKPKVDVPESPKLPPKVEENLAAKTQYKTKMGRLVAGGGGIVPDVTVESKTLGELERSLFQRGVFFEFASDWLQKHPAPTSELAKTVIQAQDDIFQDFASFVRTKAVPVAPQEGGKTAKSSLEPAAVQRQLDALETSIGTSGSSAKRERSIRELAQLRKILLDEELDELRTQKKELQVDVVESLLGRLTSPSTRLAARVAADPQVQEAQRLAADAAAYAKFLEPAPQALAGRDILFPPNEKPL